MSHVCLEPFGSLLQAGSAAAAAPPPAARGPAALSMRHNSMPHTEPWFHGRISRQKVNSIYTSLLLLHC